MPVPVPVVRGKGEGRLRRSIRCIDRACGCGGWDVVFAVEAFVSVSKEFREEIGRMRRDES